MCCCVVITGLKGENIDALQHQVAATTGYDEDTLIKMQRDIRHILNDDVAAVSPARVAQVFFERLGLPIGGPERKTPSGVVHGESLIKGVDSVLDSILADPIFLGCHPSKVAACVTHAMRMYLGYFPIWPTALADMTGYQNLSENSQTREVLQHVSASLKNLTSSSTQSTTPSTQTSSFNAQSRFSIATSSELKY
eukprot:TRINITY_DN51610_c0_g1_i4.p2 TRINITY_DN51610_c0_g1~~TRINITY_DN51610_c0_g1_i4.p2  ORF type:complete len:195 (+),score=30.63 TRINITY_DN51610_c0_g1_i4:88-672(+)